MLNYKIIHLECVDSTNKKLKEMALSGIPDRIILVADKQDAGHGQYGRVFESPAGGLYCSIYRRLELPFENPSALTLSVGNAVQKAIKEICKLDTDIKLPNDILYRGRKLCGILVESFTKGSEINIVIGIGLNVNTNVSRFSAELSETADSLKSICGKAFDKNRLIEEIIKEVDAWFNSQKQS